MLLLERRLKFATRKGISYGIHLLRVRFYGSFHVAFDELCCKQTPKVWTSVLLHIQYCNCMNCESLFQVCVNIYIFVPFHCLKLE